MTELGLNRTLIFVLVGPGGSGKNTLMQSAMSRIPNLTQMATATTRVQRENEIDGEHHYFISLETFKKLVEEEAFLEYQEVTPGAFYGILREKVENHIRNHELMTADIDVIGADILHKAYPDNIVLIFVTVPGQTLEEKLAILRQRMNTRNESEQHIRDRLDRAKNIEFPFAKECDYIIVNDDPDAATDELEDIILNHRQKVMAS
ncbi:guanylate kinase [Anaerolineales bacterium]